MSDSSPHIANIGRLVEVSAAPAATAAPVPCNCVTFSFTNNLLIPVVAGCVVAQCCSFHPSQLCVGTKPLCPLCPAQPCSGERVGVPFLSTPEQLPALRSASAATSGENCFQSGCCSALSLGLKVQCVSGVYESPGIGFAVGFCGSSQLSTRSGAAQKVLHHLLFHCTVLTEGVPDFLHCNSQERRKFSTLMHF